MSKRPRIGVSACFFHADPNRAVFRGKTLLYAEESLLHYVMSGGGYPVMVPTAAVGMSAVDLVAPLDGLVLQGGVDIAPESYGEPPHDTWPGDAVRDRYEIELVRACMEHNKPVFGICRGAQLINVALGGTLFQDLATQRPGTGVHNHPELYDAYSHSVQLVEGSRLAQLYGTTHGAINSVHHQGIKKLGTGLTAEAYAYPDEVVEAIRLTAAGCPWVMGVQWHPEYQPRPDPHQLDPGPLMEDFMAAVRQRRERR